MRISLYPLKLRLAKLKSVIDRRRAKRAEAKGLFVAFGVDPMALPVKSKLIILKPEKARALGYTVEEASA